MALALTTALGFCAGVLFGVAAGEALGIVNSDRVRRAIGRPPPGEGDGDRDPALTERNVLSALRGNARTRALDVSVRALGDGLVELVGTAQDEQARTLAERVARSVPGADVVVNRILVEDVDTDDRAAASQTT